MFTLLMCFKRFLLVLGTLFQMNLVALILFLICNKNIVLLYLAVCMCQIRILLDLILKFRTPKMQQQNQLHNLGTITAKSLAAKYRGKKEIYK